MTQDQTNQIVAAIEAARAAGRTVLAVEFPRSLGLADGPWSILGVDLMYHSWYTDGFNLKLEGTGAFLRDDEFHRFRCGPADEFEDYLAEQMRDPSFRAAYRAAELRDRRAFPAGLAVDGPEYRRRWLARRRRRR